MAMYLAIMTCVLVTVVLRLAWPALVESVGTSEAEPPKPDSDAMQVLSWAAPQSLEGALVAQLTDHVITREQYRRAMEFVATRDTDREAGPTSP